MLQGPFRPGRPLLQVFAECPRKFRCRFCLKFVTSLDRSPRSARSQALPLVLGLVAAVLLTRFLNFQLRDSQSSFEGPADVMKTRRAAVPCRNLPRVDSPVVAALFEVHWGSAKGCVAMGVLESAVEVARADPQPAAERD